MARNMQHKENVTGHNAQAGQRKRDNSQKSGDNFDTEHNLSKLTEEEKDRMHQAYSKMGQMGGQARAIQLGHEGYVELGRMGGRARAEQLGHEGYVELGQKGGRARAEQLGHEGYVELGHKGGVTRAEQMAHEGFVSRNSETYGKK